MGEAGQVDVCGEVDTHRDVHVAAVVDTVGRVLGSASFGANTAGYEQLEDWLHSLGRVIRVGVEGTGSYGAGLARYLSGAGVEVVEVNRPNRQLRRQRGKTGTADAEGAARAALSGQATARPKSGDGPVEGIRMLRMARRSAMKARTQDINQLLALVVTAPEQVKHQLRGFSTQARVKTCVRFRPGTDHTTTTYAKKTLHHRVHRYQALTTEIEELEAEINSLCARANPALLSATGTGADTAEALLVTAGDNPKCMTSEVSFAVLCGASPVQGSSGQTVRYRLNRGGNRQANNALWPYRYHPHATRPPHHRIHKKTPSRGQNPPRGHPLPQTAHRPRHLPSAHQPTPHGPHLRTRRHQTRTTLVSAAEHPNTSPTRLSQLERGLYHNHQLANQYQQWLTQHRHPERKLTQPQPN